MATIVGDVTDLQQPHHLILLEDQRPSTKGKIVSKCYNISKTPGRGSIQLPNLDSDDRPLNYASI